jgi:hypothetical protein
MSKKPSNSPGQGRYWVLLLRGRSTLAMEQSGFLFLSLFLEVPGRSDRLSSLSFLKSLLSRVASSARAYQLVMASISSDVLGFFIASFRIKEGSLSPFLKNITNGFVIDLRDDVPLVEEALNEFLKGFSLLLHDTSEVPVDS